MFKGYGCLLAACLLSFCSPPSGLAQLDSPEAVNSRALAAYQSKDYATFLVLGKQALTQNPGDPRALYNVACGEALNGHATEAVKDLDRLLGLHLDFDAEKDADFATIHSTPDWSRYTAHLAAMRQPIVRSTIAFTLPDRGLLASSVAVDQTRGDVYVGSLRDRRIIKRTKDGVVTDFASQRNGLLAVSSLLIDTVRSQLFAAVSAVPFMQGYTKDVEGQAGILVFDLSTGTLLRSAFLSVRGEHHFMTQLAEDKSGNVFAIDSGSSEIRRLRRSSSELELYISSVVFRAPRGLALSEDERTLYVMDLSSGLWAVNVLSIDRTHIEALPDVWVGGMLGLLRTPDGFISLQTGVRPIRLVRIRLSAKGENVEMVETLENNNGLYEDPMPGTLAGSDLFYIANSQLDLVDAKTGAFPILKSKETVVLRLPLSK